MQATEARATAAEHAWHSETTTAARATAERDTAVQARDAAMAQAMAAYHRADAAAEAHRAAEDTARAAVAALRAAEAERGRLAAELSARVPIQDQDRVAPASEADPPPRSLPPGATSDVAEGNASADEPAP